MGINGWRVMWLVALYDCPVGTTEQRRSYQQFHNTLLQENFTRHQFSVYVRHFPTLATAQAMAERLSHSVPEAAHLAFYFFTDKQYGMTREYFGNRTTKKKPAIMNWNWRKYLSKTGQFSPRVNPILARKKDQINDPNTV